MTMPTIPTALGLVAAGLLLTACGGGSTSGDASDGGAVASKPVVETAVELDSGAMLSSKAVILDPTGPYGAVGYLGVRLDSDPGAATTVTISHAGGDADQIIYLGHGTFATSHDLSFDSSNWDQWQSLTLSALSDTDGETTTTWALSGADIDGAEVSSVVAPIADVTITGTIARSGFVAAKPAWDAHDDIAFTLSWRKVGSGADARYYGTYVDDDPLNAPPADAQSTGADGNAARDDYRYPAYGFIAEDDFHVIVAKSVVTPRTNVEANLLVLTFDSDDADDLTTGSGLLTATDLAYTTGTYPISFTATVEESAGALTALIPLADPADYPLDGVPLQLSRYGGAGGTSVIGQWDLALDGYLFDGDSFDGGGSDDGDLHGLVVGSPAGLGIPSILGVREDAASGDLSIFGLPFYAEPDDEFPFGTLGGRSVALSDGTTDRAFLFAAFLSN